MKPFTTSLSDLLLLGFCSQQHQAARWSLFELFEQRLRPFVPLLTQTQWRTITPEEVPFDIEWYVLTEVTPDGPEPDEKTATVLVNRSRGTSRDVRPHFHLLPSRTTSFDDEAFFVGRALSSPKAAYLGNAPEERASPLGFLPQSKSGGKVVCVTWDRSRRSLIELVIDHIHQSCPSAEHELVDRRAIPASERWLWDFVTRLDEKYESPPPPFDYEPLEGEIPWWIVDDGDGQVFGLTDWLDGFVPNKWDKSVIGKAIQQVVSDATADQEVFDIGRKFAELIQLCESFEDSLSDLQEALCAYGGSDDHGLISETRVYDAIDNADSTHPELCHAIKAILSSPWLRWSPHATSILVVLRHFFLVDFR